MLDQIAAVQKGNCYLEFFRFSIFVFAPLIPACASRAARKWKIENRGIFAAQKLAEDARFELALRF